MKVKTVLVLCVLLAGVGAVALADPVADAIGDLNEQGMGTVSGKVQLLWMGRIADGDGTDAQELSANSATLGLTLGYKTPEFMGLSVGMQYVHVGELYEGGSWDDPATTEGQANYVNNSGYSLLNELYVNLNLAELGLEGTSIKVGRQILNLDLAPAYAIRQKSQSYEAAVLSYSDECLSLALGHIERYSSWTSNIVHEDSFLELDEAFGIPYGDNGLQFVSATYTGIQNLSLSAYDYYARDIVNTIGAKVAYTIAIDEQTSITPKFHAAGQRDVGKFDRETGGNIHSRVYDTSLVLKSGDLTIEPGFLAVPGDANENDFQTPFHTRYTVDYTLNWYEPIGATNIESGSDCYYLKATYALGKTKITAMYVQTEYEEQAGRNLDGDKEIVLVVGRKLTDSISATVKLSHGRRDQTNNTADSRRNDMRLFLAYTF